jgi:signal transduction histidine kinase
MQMEDEGQKSGSKGIPLSSARPQIQSLLDALPFYVLLVDSDHRIVAANNRITADLQLSPQQVAGSYCPLVVHGFDSPSAECPLVEALQKGTAVERELFHAVDSKWIRAAVFPTSLIGDDGKPIYLHFARDVSAIKQTEEKLAQSLEHHSALSELLQRFQYCRTGTQILEALINQISSLSWLGTASAAVGFLVKDRQLEMTVQRNVPFGQLSRCQFVKFGECLCGIAAETGRSTVCSSSSSEHTQRYEGMGEHQHAVLPIVHEGQVLGVLTLYIKSGNELNTFQADFLDAAVSVAGAALGAQLASEEVRRVRDRSMAQVLSYEEDERKHIAMELHDQVCQSLSALLLKIQSQPVMDESLRGMQKDCEARIRSLIDNVSNMAGQLRPTILDDYGLEMAVARYTEVLSSRTGLTIDYQNFSNPEQQGRLPVAVEVALYRVAIEALDNTVSHAAASGASVIILRRPGKIMLLVEDDGRGFDYSEVRKDLARCRGIIGMEERITLLGGTLRIESTPQKGTTIRAEIPIEEK